VGNEALLRTLGPAHPDTLRAKANLAITLDAQGDFFGARKLRQQAAELYLETLSPEHPATIAALANLGATLKTEGGTDPAHRPEEDRSALAMKSVTASS
jgi:hypothetical protein